MNSRARFIFTPPLALALAVAMAVTPVFTAPLAYAQNYGSAQDQPAYAQQELDQMLAPVALYPDSLLSQILMASTYPLEIVEAARWLRAHPSLKGDQAVRAVENQNWDPSVKSLVAFPQILSMMDEKLDWTQRMGDAFLAQESAVMDTVQQLRQRAYAAGNLRSNEQIRVAPQGPTLIVEPANPQVVYVPYYDPMVVYGPWWWPAYPPVYWAPWPGYHVRPGVSAGFAWGSGIAVSAGFFFGAFDWAHRQARVVNVHNYYYNRTVIVNRETHAARVVHNNVNAAPGAWRHDPDHRRGVPYREASLRQQFSRGGAASEARTQTHERNAPGAYPVRQIPPQARPAVVQPEVNTPASAPARATEQRAFETREHRNPREDNRRDERAPGRDRPQARGIESNRSDAQNAPANRAGGRMEMRAPDTSRQPAPAAQGGAAQETRNRPVATERHSGGPDGRMRAGNARPAQERATPEIRASVPASPPQAEASALRQSTPGARSDESRGEQRRENWKK